MFDTDLGHIPLQLDNKDTVLCYIELYIYILGNDFDIRCYIDKTSHRNSELVCMGMSYRTVFLDDRMVRNYEHDWHLENKKRKRKKLINNVNYI